MINPNVIDLEVIDAIIKAHPYIDAVDKQLVANKNLVKGAFPDISEVDARHCLLSDQIDIYVDFTRNGHKLCAMWHYRHAADDGKMEAATGLSVSMGETVRLPCVMSAVSTAAKRTSLSSSAVHSSRKLYSPR